MISALIFLSAVYLFFVCFSMDTYGIRNTVAFKLIPFLLGLGLFVYGLALVNIISFG